MERRRWQRNSCCLTASASRGALPELSSAASASWTSERRREAMARKVETHLHYYIAHGLDESADLEGIVETTSRLKVAKEQAAASSCDVEVTVRLIGHEGGSCNYCAL